MKAEEIRKLRDESIGANVDGSLSGHELQSWFLAEIAAQLAELNEKATQPELEKLRDYREKVKRIAEVDAELRKLIMDLKSRKVGGHES